MEMSASITDQDPLIQELQIEIEDNLVPEPDLSECCIYRVPKNIRSINNEAYTPQLISIGPFHHGRKRLANMEKQKSIYMTSFLARITMEKRNEILVFLKNNEQKIRSCYAEQNFNLKNRKEFTMMILYDAIFVIEFFIRYYYKYKNDLLMVIPAIKHSLFVDLQLLENQLPYFILEEIYKLAFIGGDKPTFMELSRYFFGAFSKMFRDSLPPEVEVKHFVDWRRRALLINHTRYVQSNRSMRSLPSAVKLHESGVKFKLLEGACLLDIRYEKRKQLIPCFKTLELKIPHFGVGDETECLIRNMIALEQCHYPNDTLICNYIDLLDKLINTEKDADLFVGEGIITNLLGADNVLLANMFNKLCIGVHCDYSSYYGLTKELKEHFDKPRNHAMATLKRVYFSNLWRGTGTVAAILLLVLTVIQTICSIMQVV